MRPSPSDQTRQLGYPFLAKYQASVILFGRNTKRGGIPFKPNTRTALPSRAKYQDRLTPFRSNARAGLSHSDQIPGRRYPLGRIQGGDYPLQAKYQGVDTPFISNTVTVLSFRGDLPGWGYPLQTKNQGGLSPSGQVPGRGYPLQIKYRDGVSPYGKFHGGVTPLRSNTRAGISPSYQTPKRCYHLGA